MNELFLFHEYMKMLRDSLGMKQDELADTLGISRPYISLMETGKRSPSLKVLYRLRKAYGFSLDAMVDRVEESSIPDL